MFPGIGVVVARLPVLELAFALWADKRIDGITGVKVDTGVEHLRFQGNIRRFRSQQSGGCIDPSKERMLQGFRRQDPIFRIPGQKAPDQVQ